MLRFFYKIILSLLIVLLAYAAILASKNWALIDNSVFKTGKDKPAHHGNQVFINPYQPESKLGFWDVIKMRFFDKDQYPTLPHNYHYLIEKADLNNIHHPDPQRAQATWLGHSSVLLQYRHSNILFDPIFSQRASLVQFAGPKRYTQPALSIAQLPKIDVVIISHSHFDHLDKNTVQQIGNSAKWLVPLGLKKWFAALGVSNIQEFDWWQSQQFKHGDNQFEVIATPSQHWSRRSLFDKNKSLWASWAVRWQDYTTWFGGDTSYNQVQFKEIGSHLKQVDLALIPIGAYLPRWFMRYSHINPQEAVKIFQDIRAQHAFGIHFNTFILTAEKLKAPPEELAKSLAAAKIDPKRFQAINIGHTWHAPQQP